MKLPGYCLLLGVVMLAGTGCGKKAISSLDRKKADNLASEAMFAVTVREYGRAEGLLVQATGLCPDSAQYWLALGTTRMRLGQRDGARTAYKRALDAFEDDADADRTQAEPALQQVQVLALLGRVDDARALLAKLPKRYPGNRDIQGYIDSKALDRMLADSGFKRSAL
ncbi:MAG TPA: tetratricopeptide repeat protein [Opitutaceae bacterium]|nr:tetratricopeptide repeat protein [Opitutaceae bacterium]